jgi:hypothetical protein
MKKPNKYSLLHLSNIRFAKSNLRLLSHNAKLKDEIKELKSIINTTEKETMLKETMNTQDKIVINLSSFKYYNQLGGFYACKLPKGTKHIKSNCPRDLRIKLEKLGYEVNTDK